jgi:hypothetical protein
MLSIVFEEKRSNATFYFWGLLEKRLGEKPWKWRARRELNPRPFGSKAGKWKIEGVRVVQECFS